MNNGFSSPRPDAFPAGLRVLVVDDDSAWLRILEKMLKKCKYEVTTCCSATNALNLLREKKDGYDIVISDVNMPDMDGFKLLEHVGLEMDLPVIMMSVDGETSRVMKGVQHGACDYLLKPISMKELKNIWLHVFRKKIYEIREIESQEGFDVSFEAFLSRNGVDQSDDFHMLSGDDMSSMKKRKDLDNNHGEKDLGDSSSTKKARVVWSVDLHQKFVKAVNQIGFDKVGPKKILDLMNVPWLTRENVASHLQKYRLYLSRLQKENDAKSSYNGVKRDSPAENPPASLDVNKSMNTERNVVPIHGNQFSECSLKSYNDSRLSNECNLIGISLESSTEPTKVPIGNNTESHVRRTRLKGPNHPLSTQVSGTSFETFNRTLQAVNAWKEAPRVQLKQEPQHFENRFNQLPSRGKQHHIQLNVPQVPSINSTHARRDTETNVTSFSIDFEGDQLGCLCSVDGESHMLNQEPQGQHSSSTAATASGGKTQGFDLSCISDMEYHQGNLLANEGISMPLDEELQYPLLYGNLNTVNYGVQNTELSEYNNPGLIADVPIYFYDTLRFENWYPYNPANYSLIDESV